MHPLRSLDCHSPPLFCPCRWLDTVNAATFDIVAIYHGEAAANFSCPACIQVFPIRGPKWRLFMELTSLPEWGPLAGRYDYVMLPDDDLDMSTCALNKVG